MKTQFQKFPRFTALALLLVAGLTAALGMASHRLAVTTTPAAGAGAHPSDWPPMGCPSCANDSL